MLWWTENKPAPGSAWVPQFLHLSNGMMIMPALRSLATGSFIQKAFLEQHSAQMDRDTKTFGVLGFRISILITIESLSLDLNLGKCHLSMPQFPCLPKKMLGHRVPQELLSGSMVVSGAIRRDYRCVILDICVCS